MSVIDNQAKAIAEPMILGRPLVLFPKQQLILATWATMRAYVFEEETHTRVSTDDDRAILYTDKRPSGDTRVRIAAYEGRPGKLEVLLNNVPMFDGAMPPSTVTGHEAAPIAYAFTILLGYLIVQVLGRPTSNYRPFENLGKAHHATTDILPPTIPKAFWPPAAAISPTGLDDFMKEPFPQIR